MVANFREFPKGNEESYFYFGRRVRRVGPGNRVHRSVEDYSEGREV